METTMGPPLLPGFSLRVMLFQANAYNQGDRPLRCFRVVTSPDATVRDFCQEASRIHEINYGEPIAIKKVQDDQEFDITQGELLKSLFKNLDTIRVIQAATHPSIRDSLPPTSALRFDPGTSRKRGREESAQPSGSANPNSFTSNKRQRVSDIDPDHPLPSREIEMNGRRPSLIPDSQESSVSEATNGVYTKPRHVRTSLPRRIPRTPSPPPQLRKTTSENDSADHRGNQSDNQSLNGNFNHPARTDRSSSLRDAPQPAQSHASTLPRAKSASYHIPRSNERGTSVSTAATSPLSVDQPASLYNSAIATNSRKKEEPILPPHDGMTRRSSNEQSIYDNITSDEEGLGIMKARRATSRQKSSPRAGFLASDLANRTSNTSPGATQPSPGSREQATTPGKLPLTPNSKKREDNRLQTIENARNAGKAAERRKREADEARQVEEARVAVEERAKREEQERLEIEEFKRGEAERKAIVERTARLQREREAHEKEEAEEKKRITLEQVAKEKAIAAEEKRLYDLEDEGKKKAAEAEISKRPQEEGSKARLPSSPAEARPVVSSSPILPKGTPGSRAHSGTPFIPPRKSALKNVVSSQAMRSSSPAGPSRSPDMASRGVGIETQMPLPKSNRRVSFKQEVEHNESPAPLHRRILPPARTYTSTPPSLTPKQSVVKPNAQSPIVAKVQSPSATILPPKRSSLERSITPSVPPMAIIVSNTTPTKAALGRKSHSPAIEVKQKLPPTSEARKSETPIHPPSTERSKSTSIEPPRLKSTRATQMSSHQSVSEEEMVQNESADQASKDILTLKKATPPEAQTESSTSSDNEDEEMVNRSEVNEEETQSQNSSTRDSRSPVSFIQHTKIVRPRSPLRTSSPKSSASSEDVEMRDVIDQVNSRDNRGIKASFVNLGKELSSDSESSDSDSDSESGDETKIQVPKSSPPALPAHRSGTKSIDTKLSQVKNSKDSSRDGLYSTQDQVDHQLTSSMYEVRSSMPMASTPTPAAASGTFPRPPSIKFGASLSSLHQNKLALGASSQIKPLTTRNGQGQLKLPSTGSDIESESSESESEDSSSDDGAVGTARASKQSARSASWISSKKLGASQTENSDSDASEDEEEAEKRRAGNELAAQVAAMASSQGSVVVPSPKTYNLGTQQPSTPKLKEIKAEKKRDKYTSGYVFSQVR